MVNLGQQIKVLFLHNFLPNHGYFLLALEHIFLQCSIIRGHGAAGSEEADKLRENDQLVFFIASEVI